MRELNLIELELVSGGGVDGPADVIASGANGATVGGALSAAIGGGARGAATGVRAGVVGAAVGAVAGIGIGIWDYFRDKDQKDQKAEK